MKTTLTKQSQKKKAKRKPFKVSSGRSSDVSQIAHQEEDPPAASLELAPVPDESWLNFQSTLKIRSIPGLKSPNGFPMVEVLLPIPEEWNNFVALSYISLARELSSLVCQLGESIEFFGVWAETRKDFPEVWESQIKQHLPTPRNLVDGRLICREDVWRCVEQAAASVNRPVHGVALAILGRNIPLALELRQALIERRSLEEPPGVIQGPWCS